MAEYSEVLDSIDGNLSLIAGDIHTLVAGDSSNEISGLLANQSDQLSAMNAILNEIVHENQIASAGGTIDYSSSIDSIVKSLAYNDLLLLVVAMIGVLILGVVIGGQVTKWMRSRNG